MALSCENVWALVNNTPLGKSLLDSFEKRYIEGNIYVKIYSTKIWNVYPSRMIENSRIEYILKDYKVEIYILLDVDNIMLLWLDGIKILTKHKDQARILRKSLTHALFSLVNNITFANVIYIPTYSYRFIIGKCSSIFKVSLEITTEIVIISTKLARIKILPQHLLLEGESVTQTQIEKLSLQFTSEIYHSRSYRHPRMLWVLMSFVKLYGYDFNKDLATCSSEGGKLLEFCTHPIYSVVLYLS